MLNVDKKKVLTLFAVAMLTASMLLASMKIQAGALPWYEKPAYPDYAPSGMPDFEQHQDNWGVMVGPTITYTWCGPVAVANSLWWLDSEYESIYCPLPVPPPTISDHFPLVTSYQPQLWDDHDPRNLDLLVHNLAFLMDTDGMRTGLTHTGTSYIDMETGLAQYLSQQGVNPKGDCDGDGNVDDTDIAIIEAAFDSSPGSPNWDMRADIVINNKVDQSDLDTAALHYGEWGIFWEQTFDFPEFHFVEEAILRCEDVVLFLEFFHYVPGMGWYRLYDRPEFEAGHFVTCAGVNSTTLQVTISDPYQDAAEAGFPGYVPVPHLYPHSASQHNDTQYVSHDAYNAANWPPPPHFPDPYAQPAWELVDYLQRLGYDESYHAFVRAAIVTSPWANKHDVAITDVYSYLASVYQGDIDPIIVTVTNQGDYTETVNVDAYYDGNKAAPTQTISLSSGYTTTLTFLWDTTGVPLGSYQVNATATIAIDDDPSDNSMLGNWEEVTKLPWYEKPRYPDYAPSGMPDFDEKQDNWGVGQPVTYTWCGPVAVANSLWWLDSEYESLYCPSPVPPPTISDHYPLVTSYQPQLWDDHDPRNLDPLVKNLAFLMDAGGMRTGLPHQGVSYWDMETGISQYLQRQLVNPAGDCDGDGDVDINDATIVQAAMGSIPGSLNWDMRADIVIDNQVNLMDAAVVAANMGRTGMFYEHTQEYPEFPWVEDEILRCEDVVLYLEFLVEVQPGVWEPFNEIPSFYAGHFVTCAGVNSTTQQLLISDPWWDAAEAGWPGHVPVPHPPLHPATFHNDTQYVSHDAYGVMQWTMQSPYGNPVWELTNYLHQLGFPANCHAFIRAAVVTSPLGEHDVAVTEIETSKTGCLPKETVGQGKTMRINVTVEDQGAFTETFYVTVYANNTQVGKTQVTLNAAEIKTLTFVWNTVGWTKGNYWINATADTVPLETDTADNKLDYGWTFLTLAGDVDGNRVVNIFDIVRMAGGYGSRRGQPKYDPNSDLDDNDVINIFDIVAAAGNYGKSW